jgi:hypothetical protein
MAGCQLGFKVAIDLYISRFRGLFSHFSASLVVECKKRRISVSEGLEKRDAHERKVYGGASKGGG